MAVAVAEQQLPAFTSLFSFLKLRMRACSCGGGSVRRPRLLPRPSVPKPSAAVSTSAGLLPPLARSVSTPLADSHVNVSRALPPVTSLDDAAPRPTRALPLQPRLPKLKPATVADVHPDDGPYLAPPALLATAAS